MMGAWSNNGRPAAPTGASDARHAGQIVRGGNASEGGDKGPLARALPKAFVLCAIGGALSATSTSFLAPALVAYGIVLSAMCAGVRGMAPGAVLAAAAAAAVSLPLGVSSLAGSVITSLAGVVVAAAFWAGRLTPGGSVACVAVIVAAHLGADAVISATRGMTLNETMVSLIETYRQSLTEASPTVSAQIESAASLMRFFWPVAYVAIGFAEGMFAHVGVRLLRAPLSGQGRQVPSLDAYDVPLWVVAVLVATAGALAVALTVPSAPDAMLMASANLAMALRFAFAVQGAAVLAWFMREKGVGSLSRVLLGALALYLEVQFVVLTVVGVVDVWADFRHLRRGGDAGGDDAANQDKEPAQAG